MSYQPPPPPTDPYAAGPTGTKPGELLDRFVARLIDMILLAVVNAIIVSVIVAGAIMGGSGGFGVASSWAIGAVAAVLSSALYLGYFTFLESSRGQTLGKMIMKLHTVGPGGGHPTVEQAARRNIWVAFGILGVIPIIGGILGSIGTLVAVIMIAVGINNDTVRRQAWNDHFAGETQVLKQF